MRRTTRRRTQRGGRLVLSANNLERQSIEVETILGFSRQLASAHNILEQKQIVNEMAKFLAQVRIVPFSNKWREATLIKLNEFLTSMGNEPEYYENIMAAIANLERYN